MSSKKCILAYSGGMDSTISIVWISEHYGYDVIPVSIDIGGTVNYTSIRKNALNSGAAECFIIDCKEEFVENFIFHCLKSGAIYEKYYPMSSAIARPLIAKKLVETAEKTGAIAIAHGCTGKGNDQVRFEASIKILSAKKATPYQIIAPARDWEMTRDEEKQYAKKAGMQLQEVSADKKVYSIDQNLWGVAIEGEDLEDTWRQPTEDAYLWTKSLDETPNRPEIIKITFEQCIPIKINDEPLSPVKLIQLLNSFGSEHGVGRIDLTENRLVGIKSREIYEAPAATILHKALDSLERLTLDRKQLRLKWQLSTVYSDLVYEGLWYSSLRSNLDVLFDDMQKYTSGDVLISLFKGSANVIAKRSPYSLYDFGLSTYSTHDTFNHKSAAGFIDIFSLSDVVQNRRQTNFDLQ